MSAMARLSGGLPDAGGGFGVVGTVGSWCAAAAVGAGLAAAFAAAAAAAA